MDAAGFRVSDGLEPSIHVMRLDFAAGHRRRGPPGGPLEVHPPAHARRRARRGTVVLRRPWRGAARRVRGPPARARRGRWASRCGRTPTTCAAGAPCSAAGLARLLVADHDGLLVGGLVPLPPGRHPRHRLLGRPGRVAGGPAGHDAPAALDGHPRRPAAKALRPSSWAAWTCPDSASLPAPGEPGLRPLRAQARLRRASGSTGRRPVASCCAPEPSAWRAAGAASSMPCGVRR